MIRYLSMATKATAITAFIVLGYRLGRWALWDRFIEDIPFGVKVFASATSGVFCILATAACLWALWSLLSMFIEDIQDKLDKDV